MAFVFGIAAILILWIVSGLQSGSWNPFSFAVGEDGRMSTSKFQLLLWTAVAIFGYVTVWGQRVLGGDFTPMPEMPKNLLIALGLASGTAAIAKGVTSAFIADGKLTKTAATQGPRPAGLFRSDDGSADLGKIQMIAWTFVAVAIYLVLVVHVVTTSDAPELPDIDSSLMVLMGIGQGAYLGIKIASPAT